MMALLPKATPQPARKADMVASIESRLSGDFLRKLWARLDEIQQLAVREALDTPHRAFDQHQFKAKYGRLPYGFGTATDRARASPLHFFLYAPRRHVTQPTIIPPDLAQRLRAFVPPPPETEMPAVQELPQAVELPRSHPGDKQSFVRMELERRDMERTAQHDLLAVLRLIEEGRVAVSAARDGRPPRRASASPRRSPAATSSTRPRARLPNGSGRSVRSGRSPGRASCRRPSWPSCGDPGWR